jgi:hypothetical protein
VAEGRAAGALSLGHGRRITRCRALAWGLADAARGGPNVAALGDPFRYTDLL